jgi:hypothetical protein
MVSLCDAHWRNFGENLEIGIDEAGSMNINCSVLHTSQNPHSRLSFSVLPITGPAGGFFCI